MPDTEEETDAVTGEVLSGEKESCLDTFFAGCTMP
jgi:hypothetical protein